MDTQQSRVDRSAAQDVRWYVDDALMLHLYRSKDFHTQELVKFWHDRQIQWIDIESLNGTQWVGFWVRKAKVNTTWGANWGPNNKLTSNGKMHKLFIWLALHGLIPFFLYSSFYWWYFGTLRKGVIHFLYKLANPNLLLFWVNLRHKTAAITRLLFVELSYG